MGMQPSAEAVKYLDQLKHLAKTYAAYLMSCVELSPGETLQKFDLQGTLSGTPLNLNIAELKLNLDDVTGEGRAGLDMTGAQHQRSPPT